MDFDDLMPSKTGPTVDDIVNAALSLEMLIREYVLANENNEAHDWMVRTVTAIKLGTDPFYITNEDLDN